MHTGNTRIGGIVALALMMLVGNVGGANGQGQNESPDIIPAYFPYPASLRPQVEFWRKVFATYSKYQVVIHDSETMKIYKVVDFRPLLDEEGLDEATVLQIRQEQTKVKVEQVRSILFKLHQCGEDCGELSVEEKQIRDMFRKVNDPDKFRIVNQVVLGNLEVATKLLAAKPDKGLEARIKKMQADCDKCLKKLGA